ncbi:hypothetical protein J2046_003024 [Rhizobium petrolearium]|uniref:hypothetical protein n=1 Tax=Neorhizobium petrolearium TaxID=515361 RepID=UPI001AE52668|nr:hypothetical protein [Neorhizobium petrolearium]MBP1844757.1 hypothetical protein [Neorhizobium petrolearium]
MTFKLFSELTFPWPVKVMEPDPAKPGKHILREFEVTFAILPPERIQASRDARLAILKKMDRKTVGEDGVEEPLGLDELKLIQAELEEHDKAAVQDVVRGWSKIVDADDGDKPIPFTDATFRALYAIERVKMGLLNAYEEAISQDRARLKN